MSDPNELKLKSNRSKKVSDPSSESTPKKRQPSRSKVSFDEAAVPKVAKHVGNLKFSSRTASMPDVSSAPPPKVVPPITFKRVHAFGSTYNVVDSSQNVGSKKSLVGRGSRGNLASNKDSAPQKQTTTSRPLSRMSGAKSMANVSSRTESNAESTGAKIGRGSKTNVASAKQGNFETAQSMSDIPAAPVEKVLTKAKSTFHLQRGQGQKDSDAVPKRRLLSWSNDAAYKKALENKERKEREMLEKADKNSPYFPTNAKVLAEIAARGNLGSSASSSGSNPRRSARIQSTSSSGESVSTVDELALLDSSHFSDLEFLWGVEETAIAKGKKEPDSAAKFPLPIYRSRNLFLKDYERECVLRTQFMGYHDFTFRQHLLRAESFRINPDPRYIYWVLNATGQPDSPSVMQPQQLMTSMEVFSRIEQPTLQDIRTVLDYATRLSTFFQHICSRAFRRLLAQHCLSTGAEEEALSFFDNWDQVLAYYSSRKLKLPDMRTFLKGVCRALFDQMKNIPAPIAPNFEQLEKDKIAALNKGKRKKKSATPSSVISPPAPTAGPVLTQEMIDLVKPSNYLTPTENAFWGKFLGRELSETVLLSHSWELSVENMLSFRRNQLLQENVIDALLYVIGDPGNTVLQMPSRNYYVLLIRDVNNLMLSRESFMIHQTHHLRVIGERRQFHQEWMLREKQGNKKKQFDESFTILFALHFGTNGGISPGRYALVSAELNEKSVTLFDPSATVGSMVGLSNDPVTRELREILFTIRRFLSGVTRDPWLGNNWPSGQLYSDKPCPEFPSATNSPDWGVVLILYFENFFQDELHYLATHNTALLENGILDRQRYEYLHYVLDRFQGLMEPSLRKLWEPTRQHPQQFPRDPDDPPIPRFCSLV